MSSESALEALRFPIGRWEKPEQISAAERAECQATIAAFPAKLRKRLAKASDAQLDMAYRPEGWTIRQVVHHCADSHMNALVRIKLSLTEEQPTIKPYYEERWAQLPDYILPVEGSLRLIEAVHARLTYLMEHMRAQDWARTYMHPQYGSIFRMDQVASLYAWHCKHHFGHVSIIVPSSKVPS